jgi:hypothetical protein
VVCGGLTEKMVSRLGLKEKSASASQLEEPMLGGDLLGHLGGDGEQMRWEDESRSLLAMWRRFDRDWMKRYFGGKHADRMYRPTTGGGGGHADDHAGGADAGLLAASSSPSAALAAGTSPSSGPAAVVNKDGGHHHHALPPLSSMDSRKQAANSFVEERLD